MSERSAQRCFKRNIAALGELFEFIEDFLAGDPIDTQARYAITLAVEELFTNTVKYNPGNPNDVLLELCRLDDRVSVSLTDFDSDRFDIREVEQVRTDRPLGDRTPGRLGIHLVKQLMDRIDYEYTDRRSRTTLVKLLE